MRYSQWIGVLVAVVLAVACFMPWTYYPDLDAYFTGFYSHQNLYGKPGKVFIVLSAIAIILFAVNRVWAKRANLLVCAFIVAYATRIFFVYTACYGGICPAKQAGIYIVILAPIIMLVMAFLPRMKRI